MHLYAGSKRDSVSFGCPKNYLFSMCLCLSGLFETLPGRVQCEMLLKATEQCFNTLEKAEMLLLLLKRFPESVVQHGVCNSNNTVLIIMIIIITIMITKL